MTQPSNQPAPAPRPGPAPRPLPPDVRRKVGIGLLIAAGLLLGRPAERASAGMRRLLYGYNAVLGGLLLLSILGVANLLASVRVGPLGFFSRQWDWTAAQIYSIKPATRQFLEHLDRPVKV